MKRSISLVMCLVMLVSMFSVLGVTAGAAATDLMYVKASGFKNDTITYTVYLKENITVSGAVVHAKFDSSVLQLVSAGSYQVDDGDGGTRANVSGMYEAGYFHDTSDNRYCIGYTYTGKNDYNVGSKAKAFIQFTFKAINPDRPKATVDFLCWEFSSVNTPSNNIPSESSELICSDTRTTLGETILGSIASDNGGVKITWKKTTGADYYRVYKMVNGKYEILDEVTTTSYKDTDVKNNNVYQYTVRAMNEAGFNSSYNKAGLSTRYIVAPTTLKVAIGVNSVSASWSKVSGANRYRLYRREVKADGTYSGWTLLAKDTTALKFTDKSKLVSNKTYQYCIRALASDGASATYKFATINYVATPTVKAKSTYNGVKVSWNKVEGAVKYRVYRKVSGEKSWTKLKDVGSTTFSYTDAKAPNNKKIYYTVKAFTADSAGAYSAAAVNYLKAPVVKVANAASGVKVSWGKIAGAKQYVVYRKAAGATSWSRVAVVKTNGYGDKSVKSGTKYTYTVKAYNGSFYSSYNTAGVAIEFLSRPKLSSAVSSKSGITVKWGAVTGAKGYIVYRKAAGDSSWTKLGKVSGVKTVSYLDKAAKKGTTYTYTVRAFDGASSSAYYSGISCKDKY